MIGRMRCSHGRRAAGWRALVVLLCAGQLVFGAGPAIASAPVMLLLAPVVPGSGPYTHPAGGVFVAEAAPEPAPRDAIHESQVERDPDPWEPFNRGIFWINEKGDIYLVGPMAKGWRLVTPAFFRRAIENFNGLLLLPVIGINDLLQLKPANAWDDLMRLVFNATFGLAGLIDIATLLDIPKNDEDFGQTLGFWGVPEGPYLVIPIFGPSNVRDAIGRALDAAGTLYFSLLPFWVTFIVRGVDLVNLRSRYIEEIDDNRRESFDYYVFMRNAYLQNRRAKVNRARGVEAETSADEDLYYFEDEYPDEAEDPDGGARDR
jgi:phospholipid-binding lipoprotein MlaA